MAYVNINIERIIASSQEIVRIAECLRKAQECTENVRLEGVLNVNQSYRIERSIKKAVNNISNEAAYMSSMGSALEVIAHAYRKTEEALLNVDMDSPSTNTANSARGTVIKEWFNKFWKWITHKEPDNHDTPTLKQEKAADAAMKKQLWQVLQDEKYSQKHWDRASVKERKQILQDYMDEVIRIYGLQDVKAKINWDSNATYKSNTITWGYYTHGTHTVTLNERALSDSVGSWDSYELLETVSHELRHAYQHEAIDHPNDYMVSPETITAWSENFRHYISSSDDYDGYRKQVVEVDARDFQVTRDGRY